jgi:hypothetical protein
VQEQIAAGPHGIGCGARLALGKARPFHDQRIGHDQAIEAQILPQAVEDDLGEGCRPAARIERWKAHMRGHHRRHLRINRGVEGHEIHGAKLTSIDVDHRQGVVRIRKRAPMPRIVFDTGQRPNPLASVDPFTNTVGDPLGVGPKGASLDDGILDGEVKVGDRREHPVDPHRSCLGRR